MGFREWPDPDGSVVNQLAGVSGPPPRMTFRLEGRQLDQSATLRFRTRFVSVGTREASLTS
jgi:hypothetical protein